MKNNSYTGVVTPERHVLLNDQPFTPRGPLASAAIFAWGNVTAGAQNLASSILWEETEDQVLVLRLSELFCREVVAAVPSTVDFLLRSQEIQEWCDEHRLVSV